jgi:hypothetical protein
MAGPLPIASIAVATDPSKIFFSIELPFFVVVRLTRLQDTDQGAGGMVFLLNATHLVQA